MSFFPYFLAKKLQFTTFTIPIRSNDKFRRSSSSSDTTITFFPETQLLLLLVERRMRSWSPMQNAAFIRVRRLCCRAQAHFKSLLHWDHYRACRIPDLAFFGLFWSRNVHKTKQCLAQEISSGSVPLFSLSSEPRGVHEISPRGLSPSGSAGGLRGRHRRRAERHELQDMTMMMWRANWHKNETCYVQHEEDSFSYSIFVWNYEDPSARETNRIWVCNPKSRFGIYLFIM